MAVPLRIRSHPLRSGKGRHGAGERLDRGTDSKLKPEPFRDCKKYRADTIGPHATPRKFVEIPVARTGLVLG